MIFFSIFRAVNIMKSYCLSGLMKRAGNSDSETHVKRLNPTSRTEIKRKPRKYLFLETPCIYVKGYISNLFLHQAVCRLDV